MNPKFDHYLKNGETYSAYTHKPATIISYEDAPAFCNMTKRMFMACLKKYPTLSYFEDWSSKAYLDFELQTWVNAITYHKSLKPAWKRGLEKMKNLVFVDRTNIISEIKDLYHLNWDESRRIRYAYGDRHIQGYQQGIRDVLNVLYSHKIRTWDYIPSVNDVVRTKNGTGVVKKILGDRVLVDISVIDTSGELEHWVLEYRFSKIVETDILLIWYSELNPHHDGRPFVWDYTNLPYSRIV